MKILMIAPQPFFQPRGTPLSVLHRLNTLAKLGHEIDLVTYHIGENIPIENVTYHRMMKVPFVKKIKIGPSRTKIVLDIFLIFKALKLLIKNEYDVIHSHEEACFFAKWFARLFGVRHLYDMHSSLPQQLTNFKFTKFRLFIKIFEKLENSTISNADAVITICPELYNYVKQVFPEKQQMLIENVADNNTVFKQSENQTMNVREHYHLNGNLVILYFGTFEPYQGINLLIEASERITSRFNNARFLLVGGHQDQVDQFKNRIAALHLDDYFVFTGQVKPYQIESFIQASDILVTPRLEGNNTPLKIYEYLRAGKPIVATNHITHTQVLNDEVSILTDCNAESFSSGILQVLDDKKLANKIANNAKQLAEEKYSYKAYVEKTRRIYEVLET